MYFKQGYKNAMTAEDTKELLPQELEGKSDVLFGNLEDIYCFHGDIFLQDLENCISTTELVALCFTHRVLFIFYFMYKKSFSNVLIQMFYFIEYNLFYREMLSTGCTVSIAKTYPGQKGLGQV